jgi:hypothetical protein
VLGAGLYGVLIAEAKVARRSIGNAQEAPPDATGWYGRGRPGPAIKIAVLGDSAAAGCAPGLRCRRGGRPARLPAFGRQGRR